MPSKSGTIDFLDVKRWGALVGIGAVMGALNVLVGEVIPEIRDMGGSTNTMVVLALTFAADFVRRFFTDTRVVEKEEVEKLVVVDEDPVMHTKEKVGVVAWVKGLF